MLGETLADQIGASALLYAAIAYFVFDDEFFIEDLTENYPERYDEIMWWLEDIHSTFYELFGNIRVYYETTEEAHRASHRPHRCQRSYRTSGRHPAPFRLLAVRYEVRDDDLFIEASRDQSHHHLGNQWRFLAQCS